MKNKKLGNLLIEHSGYGEQEVEVVQYGWTLLVEGILSMVIALVIGIFSGMFWEVFVFCIAFSILRTYSGGFHMSTPNGSRILFGSVLVGVVMLQRYHMVTPYMGYAFVFVSMIVLFMLGPIEDKHKPLTGRELKSYRYKMEFISVGMAIAYCATMDWGVRWIAFNVALALLVVCTLGAIGNVKNKLDL